MKFNVTKLAEQSHDVDEKLMRAIQDMQAGNTDAFEVLYNHTQRFMLFKADKLLATYVNKDSELKADLVQDAYVKIFQSIYTLKEPERFYGWINMILVNTVYGYCRAHKKEVFDMEDEQDGLMVEDLSITEETPEDYVVDKEKRDYINSALESLPFEQRCAVEGYYFSDMSVEEIARWMECSEGTVKSRLNYARKKIKDAIEEIEKTKKIKLHGIFAIPVFLLLEKEEAFAGMFDAQMSQTVYEGVKKKCAKVQEKAIGGNEMNEQNLNQNGQEFQSMEEAAKFATEKSSEIAAAAQASVQATGGTASVATSIWTTALGKIMVAIIVSVVAVGTVWGGIYTFTQQEAPGTEDVPPVVQEEVQDVVVEVVDPVVESTEPDVVVQEPGNVGQDDVIVDNKEPVQDSQVENQPVQSAPEDEKVEESTEVYVETDPTKMTARSVGEFVLNYMNVYGVSGSKGKTPDHHYNATNIMGYNNGPSSVGNTDMEWKQHREEFEVDGETVPLWFYEGKRDYTEDMTWLTAGMSDWNDNTRDEKCWGKYNVLPQEVKEIFGPIMTEIYETYYFSEAELRSKAKAVPEGGNAEVDSMGRIIEGYDWGQVYYFENDKVVRLDERITDVSWTMTIPNEQNQDVMWESEYYIGVATGDGGTEYYKFVVSGAYMYQLMYVNYYSGPEADYAAAAYEFYDEVSNIMTIQVMVYKMEP